MVTTIACGALVQADVVLQTDVGPCPGHGFEVLSGPSNNVTIDLNGHRVFAQPHSPPGPNGPWSGIRVASTSGVTIKNGTVTGFGYGVSLDGVTRSTVSNMTVMDNIGGAGVYLFFAHDNVVRDNRIVHNGPIGGVLLDFSGGDIIEGNLVQGNNVRNSTDSHFPGQITQQDVGIFLRGGAFAPRGDDDRRGGHIVRNNQVTGNGYHGIGLVGFTSANTLVGNQVTDNGYDKPSTSPLLTYGDGIHVASPGTVVEANNVARNGGNGIFVLVSGNTIRRNSSVLNAQRPNLLPNFDLKDNQFGCPGNVWSQNRFLTFNQACVTT